MKKILVMVAVAIMTAMSVQAQIPAEVKDILEKCAEKNHHSGGYELDMKLHVGAVIASMNGTMKMCMKGEKSFSVIQMKVMGHEIYTETGFDGTQTWRYSKAADDEERDTLTITKGALKKKDKFAIDMGLDMKYKKAKLKTTDKHYEITFTEPLNKETPKKSIIRIDKNKYLLHEYETKVSIASVKMTVTRIKYGVSDNMFVLDPKKYPNAVVVRK
jgi:outer membrane lipoprotein-sorting protein